jgi:TolA-binding protein
MQRCIILILLTVAMGASSPFTFAQADAEAAFEQGRTAYTNGQFAEARDLFQKASQTDNRNPEVFLWLGKAQYQLGALEEAIAAWTRTLKLAPEEPYTKKMLQTLRGQLVEVDIRISLIEVMLKEKLYASAKQECGDLLKDKAVSDEQRVRVKMLQAEVLLATRNYEGAERIIHELLTQYPKLADKARMTLLLGQTKIHVPGKADEGLLLLKKVVADYGSTPSAVTAQYELAVFNLNQDINAAHIRDLSTWIADNPGHSLVEKGLERLVQAYPALTRQQAVPTAVSELSEWDMAALKTVDDLLRRSIRADEALKLTKQIVGHFDKHYAAHRAYAAAVSGCEALLKLSLSPSSRLFALRASARFRTELAVERLTVWARAGQLVPGPLPVELTSILAIYEAIHSEFPSEPVWRDQAELSERVGKLGSKVTWPSRINEPKAPYSWAVQIALPVIKANVVSSAVSKAVANVRGIVNDCAKRETERPAARGMALSIHSQLLDVLNSSNSAWAAVMLQQATLLDIDAAAVFKDNLQAGRDEDNAKLSERQKELLATLTELVTHYIGNAPKVLEVLNKHLQPWIKYGHYKVAEQAYTQLAQSLPQAQQRQAKLAIAKLWRQEVFDRQNRLVSAGLTTPRELDPILIKALELCCVLQEGLDEQDSFLEEVRGIWNSIVAHYKNLEYFEISEQAIGVRPDTKCTTADVYASLQLANLKSELARRELEQLLKQYNATEKITLTPVFKEAIEAYKNFISEHTSSPLRSQAELSIFKIAEVFVKHKAYDIAVTVYQDFAEFAANVKVLSQAAPGSSSSAERAAFAAAVAMDAKARMALAKEIQDRKEPPAKISDDFKAAIEVYRNFIKAYPKSILLDRAIEKNMAVALEYAKVSASDVADSIYAELLREVPLIRHGQRIELCRGLCQLGKAIPDHARQVLTTLTLKKRTPTTGKDTKSVGEKSFNVAEDIASIAVVTLPQAVAKPARSTVGGSVSSSDYGSAYMGPDDLIINDSRVLAAIHQQEVSRAARVAQLREQLSYQPVPQGQKRQLQEQAPTQTPVLSDAEISRQQKALNAAYEIFQAIRNKYPATITAEQARGEIKVMIDHWRTLRKWQYAAAMAKRFLKDNPTDKELPVLRLGIARDYLAWAAQPVEDKPSRQLMLGEVAQRFGKARDELARVVTDFPKEQTLLQQAQWDIANSFLTQARVVNAFSTTLARGQYVRAATELQHLADKYYDHPKIGTIPQILWDISGELAKRQYYEEAITVWNDLMIRYPTHNLAQEAALKIAQTYQNNLGQPLRAAEAYQEVNVARGGTDAGIQNAIYQIGAQLKDKKRWVEALHVLEMFVDSFPRHAQAGQALTMIGQIHQANEAWEDAIAAYRRVIAEFPAGNWVKDAKWSIAECTINLSQWRQAMNGYEAYARDYSGDAKVPEANRRVGILKDLVRYQTLVDEEGQRKAFDAQYQIAKIVLEQLSNRVKAVIEFRKVVENWPKSHLADDALHAIGTTYLAMGETDKAREAAKSVAKQYPGSPLADDALYMVGKSFEDEANKFATATRAKTVELAQETAQREAYRNVQAARGKQMALQQRIISSLKKGGMGQKAELEEAKVAADNVWFNVANVDLEVERAGQVVVALTAVQLANRQDKINAALRKAVGAYNEASKVAGGDKAGDALLRMATIYYERLKDSNAAMAAWLEIVRQFSGTAVAEDASWRIAQYYEREEKYAEAIEAYRAFLRNYRRSPKAGDAQFAIAENSEHLGQWIDAMDAYTNYINNFPSGPMLNKAREQINWIKAYRL